MKETTMLFLDNQESQNTNNAFSAYLDSVIAYASLVDSGGVGFIPGKKTYRMLGTKVDVVNGNKRIYPRQVMTDAINTWKKNRKGAMGEAGHPQAYTRADGTLGWRSAIENQVIKIVDIHHPDAEGNVYFDFQVLDTQKGKDLQAILDAEGQIGCSMRAGGKGKVARYNGEEVTVATFIDLFGFDMLFDPALPNTLGSVIPLTDSQIESMLAESAQKKENETQTFTDEIESILEEIEAAETWKELREIRKKAATIPMTEVERAAVLAAFNAKNCFVDSQSGAQNFSDAVDPYLKKIKEAEKLSDLVMIKNEVAAAELDEVDRLAFNSAYYSRLYQIKELQEVLEDEAALEQKKGQGKIGFTDSQNNPKGENKVKFTFEELMQMTDSELQKIKKNKPEYAAMCDAILGSRAAATAQERLQAMEDAEKERKAKEEALAFLDSDEVKDKLEKLPPHMREGIRQRVDTTNLETAQKTFNDAYEFALQLVPAEKLAILGFDINQAMNDQKRATTNIQVGENQGWKEFTDKVNEAAQDAYRAFEGFRDENLVKLNKPYVDAILREFDRRHAAQLQAFADNMATGTSTQSVLSSVALHRTIIEQMFQTMSAMQFVEMIPFEGKYVDIPIESYSRSNTRPTRVGEFKPMAKGKLGLAYIRAVAAARKIAGEISLEAQTFPRSGGLNYDALGRLSYYMGGDLRREVSLDLHDEMLRASDEYNCQRVTNETPDVSGDRTKITLLRGGTAGNPNKYIPIVRPRTRTELTDSGEVTKTYNEIIVKVDGTTIDLTGAFIDYENGVIELANPLPAGAVTVDYSFVTNVVLFDLTPPNGVEKEKHFTNLVHIIGAQKALMSAEPRFFTPNFMTMSETISNEISQAEVFKNMLGIAGTELQPQGYVGKIKNIDAYEHNEPWVGGDTRLLLGRRMATKYGVETSLTMKGPYPTRDENGELTGGDEIYYFLNDAALTPQKQAFRTVRFYRSQN
ncbi:hypothetical protein ACKE5C_19150 (plasmid) [Aneurinibacillus thermoaerophilus]|uniref:Uncharacterized protein n=1 Tax=Aneurinibacillus thermoaerophilus TaxID=143495 RepID=A0ABX8YGX7_ANETH|nr:hypothetical protein [Aneurinibacillus thermoaerophilus]QYY44775.1 hypothetical protein K3F53_18750 [Aneurinibacillus thermoaerophilus]